MSKKIVRSRESYLKNWTAAISGSVLLLSIQSARAADESRMRLREFRASNQGLDRQTLRQLYRDQVKSNSNPGQFNICPVTTLPNNSRNAHNPDLGSSKLLRADRSFVRNQSMQQNAAGDAIRLANGVNLDLTDSSRDITLGRKLFENISSVDINVGGEKKTLTAGAKVSAAEYVAVRQVLAGLGQKLTVAANGSASGGEVDLSSLTSNNDVLRASNLVVPVNVTTIGDFSKGSDFRLLGDLNNYGTVHSFDADGRGRGGSIRARDILNAGGALIQSDVDLALYAERNLTNFGTITSAGNLTLTAGGNVKNSSTVTAQGDLNINAPAVNNSGTLSSVSGNVNLDGPATAALAVNNAGGRIEALNGAINVRSIEYASAFDTSVSGGDLVSKNLNLNSGSGTVNVNVKELTGTVNETGYAAHVYASTDVLTLGKTCLTGDPTFVNDTGSINITADVSVAENLTYVARDDITTSPGVSILAGDASQGHDITMIAGANITSTVGGVTIDGNASANGGSIIFGTGTYMDSRSGSVAGDHNSGNIYMYAFQGGAAGSGRVDLVDSHLRTYGVNNGTDGNVTIVAGGLSAGATDAIRLPITESFGSTQTGTVTVTTAQPISSGGDITYDTTGTRTSAAQLVAGSTVNPDAGVLIANGIAANNINIVAGDYIHSSGTLSVLYGSSVNLSAGGNGIGQETGYLKVAGAYSVSMTLKAQSLGGDVWIDYTGGNPGVITLDSSAGNQHFTVLASQGGTIATGGGISGTGTLTLTTPTLINDGNTLDFHNIIVESPAGSGLVVDGGTSGGTFTSNLAGSTNFLATNLNLTLHNTLNFTGGDVNLTVVDNPSANQLNNTGNLNGDTANNLIMNACNVTGAGTTTNFASVKLNCSIGTIVNGTGDVNLASNFVFAGHSLAILAFGDVNSTGATLIDVSDPTGTGGNVTIMAGFTFTPAPAGQIQSVSTYTITGVNPAGGKINLGGVDIITSGGAGFNGGSVTAISNQGTALRASVSLGNITTTGDTGGQVKVISQDITVGNIDTSGSVLGAGDVTLAAATPVIIGGPIQVTDGVVSGGTFDMGAAIAGNILIHNISTPGGFVHFVGATTALDSISQSAGSTLDARVLRVEMGSGVATFGAGTSSTSVDNLYASGGGATGQLHVLNQKAIQLQFIDTPAITLDVVANGNIDIVNDINANTMTLNSLTGSCNLISNVHLTGSNISISAFDLITSTATGTINAGVSLALQSSGNLRSDTFSGTIAGAFQSLSLTSVNGSIGVDSTHPFVVSRNGAVDIGASAISGNIFLTTTNTQAESLNFAQSFGSIEFHATNNGPVTLNDISAGNGNVTIAVDGNNLQIAPGGTIAANGNINISNAGLNKKTDFFNIGNGASIQALSPTPGLGNVTLTIGPVPVPVKVGKTYNKKTIAVNESAGGIVTWGKKKWAATTGPIAITAKGANVTFSNAYGKKNGIIGSNVTIVADPPVLTIAQAGTNDGAGKGGSDAVEHASSALLTSEQIPGSENGTSIRANTIELVSVDNASMAGSVSLSNAVANLACCNENLLEAGQMIEDDSYLTSYAPLQNEVDAKLCSDFDLGFTNNAPAGVATMAHSACLTMDGGSACFIPSKDTVVVTPKGTVKISANAIAYVNVDDRQLSVYDLNDHHRGSVIVEVGGISLTLSPGRHVLVTNETPKQFADINPIESVMHRDVARHDFGNERRVFTSEFSVPSAVQALKPLKIIMQSGNDRARHVSEGVIKTTAIIMQLSGNGAPYEFHARPKQVALKW